jgi:hypothetical protein
VAPAPLGPHCAVDRADGHARVGHGADLDRIVAADLGRVDVDLDQPRRREAPRVGRVPRARIGLREAGRHREHHVRLLGVLVGEIQSPEPGHAQHERVRVRHRPLGHERVRDRGVEVFGQRDQGLPVVRGAQAATYYK